MSQRQGSVKLCLTLSTMNSGKEGQKNKKGKAVISYILTDTESNKIKLRKPKASKKKEAESAAEINLDDYLNVGVKVVGKARETEKKGKKRIRTMTVTSIEKMDEKEVGEPADVQKTKVEKRAKKDALQELVINGKITKEERKNKKDKVRSQLIKNTVALNEDVVIITH